METGERYSHIAGAIGFPGKDQPGLAVVMGVEKTKDSEPSFYALEEVEAESIQNLLSGVLQLRERWGYPSQPSGFERPNNFEIYYRQMDSCLTPPANGKKRLFLGSCTKLRNYVQNLPPDIAIKGDIDSYPAVFVLGALVHNLLIRKPWERCVGRQHLYPTNYTDYASREAVITRRHLFGGRTNPGNASRGGLIPTINEN